MINIRRKKKRWFLLLSMIYVGRSMLCEGDETHRRGVAHRMEIRHRG
jgi:hypothetical protein